MGANGARAAPAGLEISFAGVVSGAATVPVAGTVRTAAEAGVAAPGFAVRPLGEAGDQSVGAAAASVVVRGGAGRVAGGGTPPQADDAP